MNKGYQNLVLLLLASFTISACSIDNSLRGSLGISMISDGTVVTPEDGGRTTLPEETLLLEITNPNDQDIIDTKILLDITVTLPGDVTADVIQIFINDELRCELYEQPFTCKWRVPAARGRVFDISVLGLSGDQEGWESITVFTIDKL